MSLYKILAAVALLFINATGFSQKIVYSEAEKDDSRKMNFEIIGKVSGNFLIYKNTRNKNYISVYNTAMEQIEKVEHDYIPDDRLINIDFFPYNDFAYLVYQYQKKNVVYCMGVKIDGKGKKISDLITLDTSHINFSASNKIYSTISSEDKSKLMVFKINSKNKSKFIITTLLFDNVLTLQKRSRFLMPMEEQDDYLDEFNVDNDGDFVFARYKRNNNETIVSTELLWKKAQSDEIQKIAIDHKDILLDELHIKVDNVNKRYFLTSFYYK